MGSKRGGVDQVSVNKPAPLHRPPAFLPPHDSPQTTKGSRVVLHSLVKVVQPVVGRFETLIVRGEGRPGLVLGNDLVEVVELERVETRRLSRSSTLARHFLLAS